MHKIIYLQVLILATLFITINTGMSSCSFTSLKINEERPLGLIIDYVKTVEGKLIAGSERQNKSILIDDYEFKFIQVAKINNIAKLNNGSPQLKYTSSSEQYDTIVTIKNHKTGSVNIVKSLYDHSFEKDTSKLKTNYGTNLVNLSKLLLFPVELKKHTSGCEYFIGKLPSEIHPPSTSIEIFVQKLNHLDGKTFINKRIETSIHERFVCFKYIDLIKNTSSNSYISYYTPSKDTIEQFYKIISKIESNDSGY